VLEKFSIDSFARLCLLQGVDQLGYLLGMDEAISSFERRAL
jgi:3-isopropylmalate/(R)-2-methylmalate dehydratase small subunit